MTITTVILMNGILAIGLLVALTLVMYLGHRVAGHPGDAGPAHSPSALEPDPRTASVGELQRAA
jgi:hypothetical protein